jgi:hypothetical protein
LDKTEAGKCWYVGANGVKQYKTVSGCDRIPLAPIGKSCPHYDSKCLPTELLNKGGRTSTQITRVTLGVLADLGYTVNYTRADALRAADLGVGCTCAKNGNGRRDLESTGQHHPDPAPQLLFQPLHRKLSAAGHQRAVEFGRSVLAERAASVSAHGRRRLIDTSDVVYVGDQVVSILIAEGDEVYSVVVHAD